MAWKINTVYNVMNGKYIETYVISWLLAYHIVGLLIRSAPQTLIFRLPTMSNHAHGKNRTPPTLLAVVVDGATHHIMNVIGCPASISLRQFCCGVYHHQPWQAAIHELPIPWTMCAWISQYICARMTYYHIYLSGANVHPQTLNDIQVSWKNYGGLRCTADEYSQQILGSQTGDIMILHHELFLATHGTGIYVPAVHVLNPARFRTETFVPADPRTQLPDVCGLSPDLVPSSVLEVKSKPLPIGLLQSYGLHFRGKKVQILAMASLSNAERDDIEMITRGQSNNLEWFMQRMGVHGMGYHVLCCRKPQDISWEADSQCNG